MPRMKLPGSSCLCSLTRSSCISRSTCWGSVIFSEAAEALRRMLLLHITGLARPSSEAFISLILYQFFFLFLTTRVRRISRLLGFILCYIIMQPFFKARPPSGPRQRAAALLSLLCSALLCRCRDRLTLQGCQPSQAQAPTTRALHSKHAKSAANHHTSREWTPLNVLATATINGWTEPQKEEKKKQRERSNLYMKSEYEEKKRHCFMDCLCPRQSNTKQTGASQTTSKTRCDVVRTMWWRVNGWMQDECMTDATAPRAKQPLASSAQSHAG